MKFKKIFQISCFIVAVSFISCFSSVYFINETGNKILINFSNYDYKKGVDSFLLENEFGLCGINLEEILCISVNIKLFEKYDNETIFYFFNLEDFIDNETYTIKRRYEDIDDSIFVTLEFVPSFTTEEHDVKTIKITRKFINKSFTEC